MHLFCFGLGYSARILAHNLQKNGFKISGTCTNIDKQRYLTSLGFNIYILNNEVNEIDGNILAGATHIVNSIPPLQEKSMVLKLLAQHNMAKLKWLGYLSTTGVYGNHNGNIVDENSKLLANNARTIARVAAEKDWLQFDIPANIFRLSGIYGNERNYFISLTEGRARRINKPGQLFSRIHVDDISNIVQHTIEQKITGEIYNCADDLPIEQEKVVKYAAELINMPPPALVEYNDISLTAMQRSFYNNNRIIDNSKIKEKLGVQLLYPTYKA
ncbi:MAG: SDR family oxidoreductase [Pseudomonadota bacterium]